MRPRKFNNTKIFHVIIFNVKISQSTVHYWLPTDKVCSQSYDQWLASFQAFPVFDRSQYAKMEGEGLVNLTTRSTTQLMSQFLDRGIHLYQQLATGR